MNAGTTILIIRGPLAGCPAVLQSSVTDEDGMTTYTVKLTEDHPTSKAYKAGVEVDIYRYEFKTGIVR